MVQRDDRFDAAPSQGQDHVEVMRHFPAGETAFPGLDAAPLDRETVGVVMQPSRQIEIPLIELIVAAGPAGPGLAGLLLPRPPVGMDIVPLDLVGGGRRSPKEIPRKFRHS